MEMPAEQVAKNILCAEACLDGQKMRRYDFTEEEFECLKSANKALEQAPIFIDDTSGLSISQLRARCRRLRHREKIALVVVDYLQLMRGSALRRDSREQEVAEISRGLKQIARDLEIPVIVLSQLNRSAERRENDDKRPQLSDLRESGAIEQDADVVIMLYRQEYYDLAQNAQRVNVGEALVQKNRNGPVGQVKLTFRKDILRFDSYLPEHDAAAGD
jgi:replicative DNA helicase